VATASERTFTTFKNFYNGIRDALAEVNLNPGDFGPLLNVNFNDYFVPPGPFLDGVGIVIDLPPLPASLDSIWAAVRPSVDLAVGNIALASFNTSLRALQWAQALEASLAALDVTPADYNPPRYLGSDGDVSSVEAEVAAHDAMADTFVARTATSLDSFDSYNQYVDSGGGGNVSQANTSSLLNNFPTFDFSFNLKVCLLESRRRCESVGRCPPPRNACVHQPIPSTRTTRTKSSTRRWRAPTSTSTRSSASSTRSPASPL
jgi:hypothetical protein